MQGGEDSWESSFDVAEGKRDFKKTLTEPGEVKYSLY